MKLVFPYNQNESESYNHQLKDLMYLNLESQKLNMSLFSITLKNWDLHIYFQFEVCFHIFLKEIFSIKSSQGNVLIPPF